VEIAADPASQRGAIPPPPNTSSWRGA